MYEYFVQIVVDPIQLFRGQYLPDQAARDEYDTKKKAKMVTETIYRLPFENLQ